MMACYHPCKNCAVDPDTCQRRAEVRDAIAGFSVTSVKFRCENRTPMFRTGNRVTFLWNWYPEPEHEDGDPIPDECCFRGTVICEKGLRFIVRVDDAPDIFEGHSPSMVFRNNRLVIKVKPADMAHTDEPDKPICTDCSAYAGETNKCWNLEVRPCDWLFK